MNISCVLTVFDASGNSDLVCIIGIVKVRVLGPVRNGDQLYAYKKRPGVAATRTRLLFEKREENDKPFLIGERFHC